MNSLLINVPDGASTGVSKHIDSGVQAFVLIASGAGVPATADIYKIMSGATAGATDGTKWAKMQVPVGEMGILYVNAQVEDIHIDFINTLELDIIFK